MIAFKTLTYIGLIIIEKPPLLRNGDKILETTAEIGP